MAENSSKSSGCRRTTSFVYACTPRRGNQVQSSLLQHSPTEQIVQRVGWWRSETLSSRGAREAPSRYLPGPEGPRSAPHSRWARDPYRLSVFYQLRTPRLSVCRGNPINSSPVQPSIGHPHNAVGICPMRSTHARLAVSAPPLYKKAPLDPRSKGTASA